MDQQQDNKFGMNAFETRATYSIAGIYSLRMLGLFLIFPVFALYAENLSEVTPILIGIAIGAYGLTQALLQIPFGMLSDRIGRKPVIIAGLLIFAAGSVVAAMSDSIWGVILGRALQGSGAIAAALMALAADLTREQNRLKIMATIGISIGFAFTLALVLGPLLNAVIGVQGIFWLIAVLALGGIAVTIFWVPNPKDSHFHRDTQPTPGQFKRVLRNIELLRVDLGIMILHMILTAVFLSLPLALRDAGLATNDHGYFYLPILLLSMAVMIPFVVIAEKYQKMKLIYTGSIMVLVLSQVGFYFFNHSIWGLGFLLFSFFAAFNILEATLPSLIAKLAPPESKGTAMGVYSTSQFSGAFMGGLMGGWVHSEFGVAGVFLFGAIAALIWWLAAIGMQEPSYLSSHIIKLNPLDDTAAKTLQTKLLNFDGVGDAVVIAEEGMAYLKIDLNNTDREKLNAFALKA